MTFGVANNLRITQNQKIRYLTLLEHFFEQQGYSTIQILKYKFARKKSFIGIVGNLEQADIILATHYDTPVLNLPRDYHPFDEEKQKKDNSNTYIVTMISFLVMLLLFSYFIVIPVYRDGQVTAMDFVAGVLCLFLLFIVVKISRYGGIPRLGNLIRNTSSVVTLLSFAKTLSKKERQRVAFAFVDYGCEDYLGYYALSSRIDRKKQQKVILLDCVGWGNLSLEKKTNGLLSSYFNQVTCVYGKKVSSQTEYEENVLNCVSKLSSLL